MLTLGRRCCGVGGPAAALMTPLGALLHRRLSGAAQPPPHSQHVFQAETKQLLDILANSLYTDRDVSNTLLRLRRGRTCKADEYRASRRV